MCGRISAASASWEKNLRLPARDEILQTSTGEGTTEYVLRGNAEAFTANLRNQGATVLDVSPMNLQEIFLEVVGKGEANVLMEVLA